MSNIKKQGNIMVPIAIVIAAVIVAVAVIFTNNNQPKVADTGNSKTGTSTEVAVEPVTEDDHLRGPLDAPVVILEYSDFGCPYCRIFHGTMQQIKDKYGDQIAWAYRHAAFRAPVQAHAAECVAELGGQEKFWEFADLVYSKESVSDRDLPSIAEELGIDKTAFNSCQTSNKYREKIATQTEQLFNAGGEGTPHSIVLTADGNMMPVPGAQSFETMDGLIADLLAEQTQ